jgi:hypothetical protein
MFFNFKTELEFLKNLRGYPPSRNGVIVPARQATQAVGIHSLESIPGLRKRLKIRAPVVGGESLPAGQPADPAGPGLLQHVSRTVQVIHVRAASATSNP